MSTNPFADFDALPQLPALPLDVQKGVNAQEAIECLMQCNGNLALAAEKLTRAHGLTPDDKLTPSKLQALCAEDLPSLQRAIKASVTIQLYSIIDIALAGAAAAIPLLEPEHAVTAAVRMANLLHTLTDDKTNTLNLNVNEQRYNALPPEMKNILAALDAIEQREVPNTIIEHSPANTYVPEGNDD